jgi:hypothetical protein
MVKIKKPSRNFAFFQEYIIEYGGLKIIASRKTKKV